MPTSKQRTVLIAAAIAALGGFFVQPKDLTNGAFAGYDLVFNAVFDHGNFAGSLVRTDVPLMAIGLAILAFTTACLYLAFQSEPALNADEI